jgi:hypothetical protein
MFIKTDKKFWEEPIAYFPPLFLLSSLISLILLKLARPE